MAVLGACLAQKSVGAGPADALVGAIFVAIAIATGLAIGARLTFVSVTIPGGAVVCVWITIFFGARRANA